MTAAVLRVAASWWRQTAQTIRTPCLLAGWTAAHCKIRLQTFRGAGGGTAPAPGRVGVVGGGSSRQDRPRIGCLPVAGSRRAAGAGEAARRPRAGRSQPLLWCDAAGAEVQGEPTAASAAWLA